MENQKELLEQIILYLRENQRVVKELAEKVNENDGFSARRLTSTSDRLLANIEKVAQIPPPNPNLPGL